MDGPLPTFHLFPKLPIELRFKIWEESLKANSSRVVEINFSSSTMRWHPCAPPPAQLHVSREARQLALNRYQPASLQRSKPQPPSVYIDFTRDIIFLRSQSASALDYYGRVYDEVLQNLDSICDNCVHIAFPGHLIAGMPLVRLLAHFRSLEILTIVAKTDVIKEPSNMDDKALHFVPDCRTRKQMGRLLMAASGAIMVSKVVKFVRYAQAIREENH